MATPRLTSEQPPHRQPRLAFISTVHPSPHLPGTGRFNAAMLRGLSSEWQITAHVPVPAHRSFGRGDRPPLKLGYPCHPFRFWYLPGPWGRAGQGRRLFNQLRTATSGVFVDRTPDLILTYWSYPDGDAAGRLAADLAIPSAVIVGGSDLLIQARDPAHRHRVLTAIARHDRVFAVGGDLRNALVNAGVADTRIRLLERGVDPVHFYPGDQATARARLGLPSDRRIVLWAGRIESVKDLPTLVSAVATLTADGRPMLALAGEGSEATRVARFAAQLGVDLLSPGSLSPANLGEWYRAADVVALSSRSEGTPNVLLEAAASGTKIVTTDAGGAGALARRLNAPVVPIGDHRALGQALERLLAGTPTLQQADPDAIPSLDAASAHLSRELRQLLPDGR